MLDVRPLTLISDADPVASPIERPRQRQRLFRYFQLLLADLACLSLTFLEGMLVAGPKASHGSIVVSIITIPIYLALAFNAKAYSIRVLAEPGFGIRRALSSFAYAVAIVLFALALSNKTGALQATLFLSMAAVAAIEIWIARLVLGNVFHRLSSGVFTDEILIVDGVDFPRPSSAMCLDASTHGLLPSLLDPVALDRFARLTKGADNIVVACTADRRAKWAMMLKSMNTRGNIIVPYLEDYGAIGVDAYGSHRTLTVSSGPISRIDRARKRAFDLAVSLFMLTALAPLLMTIALLIKLDSRGPIIFRQRRLGRDNVMFNVWKFRSMRAELTDRDGATSTQRADDRITKIGRFLRASSLDELPQLFNVLRGDMSIVGPRPHAIGSKAGSKLFWEIDARYWHRHAAKPGITGLAQVRGYRGATTHDTDLTNRLRADLEYLENWTLSRDIGIIISTFRVMIHRNAF